MSSDVFEIEVEQLKRMQTLHVAFALFDIRPRSEYEAGHIKGALHIESVEHLQRLIKNKDAAIVIYDQSGSLALAFAQSASKQGYLNIVYLKGGFSHYSS